MTSLVISVIALAVAVASLGWQVIQYLLTGSRVEVQTSVVVPVGAIDHLPYCYNITAVCRGRQAMTVNMVSIDVADGRHLAVATHLVEPISDSLPKRLQPGESASWNMPIDDLRAARRQLSTDSSRWRPFVTLATGKKVYGQRGINLK